MAALVLQPGENGYADFEDSENGDCDQDACHGTCAYHFQWRSDT